MKKSNFIQGAVIATLSIVISKILGVIYVIPFYDLIGEKGGALYGYAYSIYGMFLNLSTAGIPFAISKITSEYNALKQYYLKEKAYKISKYIICGLGLLCFLLLMFFAPVIADIFIGDIKGGNTKEDVAFVIRVVSSALLIVPLLSVKRGYLQGHKFIAPSSFSQVIEQFIRVLFIIVGSYVCLRVLNVSMTYTIGLSVFAATLSAIAAYIYILFKEKRNKSSLLQNEKATIDEQKETNKTIAYRLLSYAIPFILIDFVGSLYSMVDLSTINRTMVNLGYAMSEAESVVAILTTWGSKINMIIIAVSSGVIVSLVPNISGSNITNDVSDVKHKINQALQSLIFVVLPMTIGLSMIAISAWTIFFGSTSALGPLIYQYYVFTAFTMGIFYVSTSTMNSLGYSKMVLLALAIGLIAKIAINVPLMRLFNNIGLHASYGVITSTIIANIIVVLFNFIYIKVKKKISYKETIIRIFKLLIPLTCMIIVVYLMKMIIPDTNSRLLSLAYSLLYGVVGGAIYLFVSFKTKIVYEIFGINIINRVLTKLKIKKQVIK